MSATVRQTLSRGLSSPRDLANLSAAVGISVLSGEITPSQGRRIARLIGDTRKAIRRGERPDGGKLKQDILAILGE